MRVIATSAIALMVGMLSAAPAMSAEADSVIDAIKNGDASLNFRYRLETVDQDGFEKDATASTLRSVLGYKTGSYKGFSGFVEFENVFSLGKATYNSTINGKSQYPVVADPESTEINQAYLKYDFGNGFAIKTGRQAVLLGNLRYVGTVGWRQNHQTMDAVSGLYSGEKLSAVYAYVWNVNRIFSNDHPLGNLKTKTNILHAKYNASDYLKLEGNAISINLNSPSTALDRNLSSKTFGLKAYGAVKPSDDFKVGYVLEYANQSDYATDTIDYNVDYWVAELNAKAGGFSARVQYELLGSDDGIAAFKTPLATLHKFNGFADKFLVTPANGLEDLNFTVGYKVPGDGALSGTSFMVRYHDFSADVGGADYGSEVDWVISKKINKTFSVLLKGAHYSADTYATDTDKVILSIGAKF